MAPDNRFLLKHTGRYKKMTRLVNKAIFDYDMLLDGDRVITGISGGKDSITLLLALTERLKRIPYHYEIIPVYIDPGFEGGYTDELAQLCRELGYELICEKTDYGIRAHEDGNGENPCFICSRMRRKRLFELADELKCNKLALGHNKDDIIETLFINMFYSGRISTMVPGQPFFDNRFHIVRPLAYVEEEMILKFVAEQSLPVFKNPCPSAGKTKRKEIKDLLQSLYAVNKNIKGNIFRSMSQVKEDYLLT